MEVKTIQLNIHLQETDCRRIIQCPDNISFTALHYIIQASFGWENAHLYQFIIFDKKTKKPYVFIEPNPETDSGFFGSKRKKINSDKELLNKYFNENNKYFVVYEYDFGDGWEHLITFEKDLPFDNSKQLVSCIEGNKKCPPEDCGGIPGYYNILEVLKKKKKNADDKELLEWLGEEYNPDEFNIDKINKILATFKMK